MKVDGTCGIYTVKRVSIDFSIYAKRETYIVKRGKSDQEEYDLLIRRIVIFRFLVPVENCFFFRGDGSSSFREYPRGFFTFCPRATRGGYIKA